MARTLDPDGRVPLAVSGSVGQRLANRLCARSAFAPRRLGADGADAGALSLIRRALNLS